MIGYIKAVSERNGTAEKSRRKRAQRDEDHTKRTANVRSRLKHVHIKDQRVVLSVPLLEREIDEREELGQVGETYANET